MTDHPRFAELRAALDGVSGTLSRNWNGPVFRCVALQWARPEYLISGEGTMVHGSRWMRPRLTPVVYAASTEAIALKESRRNFAYFGISRSAREPRVTVELRVRLMNLADLNHLAAATPWPVLDDLLAEEWETANLSGAETLSQACGRALRDLGFGGLIVPSARDRRGRNLVWFPETLPDGDPVWISGQKELEDWIAN